MAVRRLRRALARWLRFHPLDPSGPSHGAQRPPDGTDALTAAQSGDFDPAGHLGGLPPPSWVKDYDEGRPRT